MLPAPRPLPVPPPAGPGDSPSSPKRPPCCRALPAAPFRLEKAFEMERARPRASPPVRVRPPRRRLGSARLGSLRGPCGPGRARAAEPDRVKTRFKTNRVPRRSPGLSRAPAWLSSSFKTAGGQSRSGPGRGPWAGPAVPPGEPRPRGKEPPPAAATAVEGAGPGLIPGCNPPASGVLPGPASPAPGPRPIAPDLTL